MTNTYCMYKGKLKAGAPYLGYPGSPHYVIRLTDGAGAEFDVVVNSASTAPTDGGDNRVYFSIDPHFADPICTDLTNLGLGLHKTGFPRLDYWQDASLLDLRRMRRVPYKDDDGSRFDINDQIDEILTIDEADPAQTLDFDNGHAVQQRKFWTPRGPGDVVVYGFGFLFEPGENGLHETHMNQGNPRQGGHFGENGVFQDGAVIVQRGPSFAAVFTAFQTQWLPTDARGRPTQDAKPLTQWIGL